jgi:hypothetical protein
VAKAGWKKNKNSDNAELGWKWSFRIGGSGKGFPYTTAAGP